LLRNQPPPFSKEVKKTLFEKEGGIARSAMTGDLGETNSNSEFVSKNPPALCATSFFKGGQENPL